MKKLFFVGAALSIILMGAGCDSASETSYEPTASEEYAAIENPYSPGTGHYAGFEWAERKDVSSCGGNSQSFIEGCEEYLRQANR